MSDELDRLLAQGPRVAPEPKVATDDGAPVPPAAPAPRSVPLAATTSADNPGRTPSTPSSGRPVSRGRTAPWRRVIPFIFFALFIAARSYGGPIEVALFGVFAVVVVTLILVRKARQL